jgi:hypothetical protein
MPWNRGSTWTERDTMSKEWRTTSANRFQDVVEKRQEVVAGFNASWRRSYDVAS